MWVSRREALEGEELQEKAAVCQFDTAIPAV